MRKAATAQEERTAPPAHEESQTEKGFSEGPLAQECKEKAATAKQYWATHPKQEVALGVTAAAGGGLIAAFLFGVGPAALAGAAGYLAYRGFKSRHTGEDKAAGFSHQPQA